MSNPTGSGEAGTVARHRKARAYAWMGRAYLIAICASIALMVIRGILGPSAPLVSFPAAPPWPPWFFQARLSAVLSPFALLLAVLLGGVGMAAGLAAVRRGWRPGPR